MAPRDLVESRGFSVGKFSLVSGIPQVLGDLLAQCHRIGALMLWQRGQLAVQGRQLVHLLHMFFVAEVEVANQRQRARQVRGEEFSIVEKVIDRRLGVWIGGGLGHLRRIVGFRHGASRGGRVDGGLGGTRQTLQPRVNQVIEETQRESEDASRNMRGRRWAAGESLSQRWMQ
ncbi:ING domain containing protein [Pyrenophora tritici-repentis]|nr:ING domain containing protein [Pyrenophora tritici-repentis]